MPSIDMPTNFGGAEPSDGVMLAVAGDGSWLSDGAEGWKLQIVS
jgi:hypothetical protein